MAMDKIVAFVAEHYASSEKPLLLSQIGSALRASGEWPPEGEARSLAEIIAQDHPDLAVERDPTARAFAVVVPKGREDLALAAIQQRQDANLVRHLPKSLLLAFCVEAPPGEKVWFKNSVPYRYIIGESSDEAALLVDDEFRTPGLFVDAPQTLPKEEAADLGRRIRGWAERVGINADELMRRDRSDGRQQSVDPVRQDGRSALERLFAAQPADLRDRMVIPVDIAVYLSRKL